MTIKNRFWVLLNKREAQEGHRIKLAQMSEVTGISRRALNAWVNDEVTRYDASVLDALCEYFSCALGDLLEYLPNEKTPARAGAEGAVGVPGES